MPALKLEGQNETSPKKPDLEFIKTTNKKLERNLSLPTDLQIALQEKNGEIKGITLSNDTLEYNIDIYSMPYCMDKITGNCFGISNAELRNILDFAKIRMNSQGKRFIFKNQKDILQNNTKPKDVFLKDKLFGYVVNFDGVLFRIETQGLGQYSLIRVDKNNSADVQREIGQNTKQEVLQRINTGIDLLSPEGRKYWEQNKEIIYSNILQ